MARKVIEDLKYTVERLPRRELLLKRALLEAVVRDAQARGDDRWKTEFDDNRVSVEEQLELINNALSKYKDPVTIKTNPAVLGGRGGQHG